MPWQNRSPRETPEKPATASQPGPLVTQQEWDDQLAADFREYLETTEQEDKVKEIVIKQGEERSGYSALMCHLEKTCAHQLT